MSDIYYSGSDNNVFVATLDNSSYLSEVDKQLFVSNALEYYSENADILVEMGEDAMPILGNIEGQDYYKVIYNGCMAYFLGATDNLITKRLIINGFDNSGYTERFKLFQTINQGDVLPTEYPSITALNNPITATAGPTGLGWPYDIAKKYGGATIHSVYGPSGTTGVFASITYTYAPYQTYPTGNTDVWVQEKVLPYVEGL